MSILKQDNIELNDGNGSYIFKYGHLHDYSKVNIEEIANDTDGKTYNSAEELIRDI